MRTGHRRPVRWNGCLVRRPLQAHGAGLEQPCIHLAQVGRHRHRRGALVEHIALQVDAGSDLDQREAGLPALPALPGPHLEHGAFGDVDHRDAQRCHVGAVEAQVRHLRHDLLHAPFAHDPQAAMVSAHFQAARGQRAHEHHRARALGDVDKATDAGDQRALAFAELADVDVALAIEFGQAEDRQVDATAFVEVELRGLVHHRLRVGRGTEAEAIRGRAADGTGFDGQREAVQPGLVRQHPHRGRHAHPQVDHARRAPRQLHHRAALHDGARIQRPGLGRRTGGIVGTPLALPRRDVGGVEGLGKGHLVVRGVVANHHVVDQDARHVDGLQDFMVIDQAFDLRDHDATRVVRRLRQRQQFVVEGFAMGAEVAARIGGAAADQRAVDRKAGVEQVFVAAELDRIDPARLAFGDGATRALVDGAAVVARVLRGAWVDKGVQADFGHHAGLAAGNGAVQVGQHALRQVVALALLRHRQRGQPRGGAPVAADHGGSHAGVAEMIDAARAAVALPGRVHQRQVTRQPVAQEALLQRLGHGLRVAGPDKARAGHGPAILHERRRFTRGDYLHCCLRFFVVPSRIAGGTLSVNAFCEHLFGKRYHTEMLPVGASPARRPPASTCLIVHFTTAPLPHTLCRKPKPPRKTNCWSR
ncbi:hypothetical protein CBM2629_A170154 [Cupriavidus taiwanensis]|nr:hypothetical protein CBM2629_A170154 [Cupriavidus taiwanensis]